MSKIRVLEGCLGYHYPLKGVKKFTVWGTAGPGRTWAQLRPPVGRRETAWIGDPRWVIVL